MSGGKLPKVKRECLLVQSLRNVIFVIKFFCVEEVMSGIKLENEAMVHVHLLRSKLLKSETLSWCNLTKYWES